MTPGTRICTTYEHSETGTICRPRAENLPLPSPDWFVIKFDSDGRKLCIHRSMFVVRKLMMTHATIGEFLFTIGIVALCLIAGLLMTWPKKEKQHG